MIISSSVPNLTGIQGILAIPALHKELPLATEILKKFESEERNRSKGRDTEMKE